MTTWDPVVLEATSPVGLETYLPAGIAADPTVPQRVQLAASTITSRVHLGEILSAEVDEWSERLDGGGDIRFEVSTRDESTVGTLVGLPLATWGDIRTGRPDLIDRAVHVVVDGEVVASYVLRSPAAPQNGRVAMAGQAPTRLFADRIIGTGNRLDRLDGRGHFPGSGTYDSLGFAWSGDPGDIEFFTPGVRGGRCLRIRGNSLTDQLTIEVLLVAGTPAAPARGTVRAGAFFYLPDDAVDETGLLSLTVRHDGDGSPWWPAPGDGNFGAAVIDEDMDRLTWSRSPITAFGGLPVPPYREWVKVTIYPASETDWTYVDEVEVFLRDSTGTGVEMDLINHIDILLRDAQEGREKSTWSFTTTMGDTTGISEVGTWRHEDNQPLTDAFSAICDRDDGPDPPWVDASWSVHCAARRGEIRTDLTIGPDDIVALAQWSHDPGVMASEMRAVTDRGDAYWRVVSVARDVSRTDGHVIERIFRASNDAGLLALDQIARGQLGRLAQPQDTCRLLVTAGMGQKVNVGDTCRVVHIDGFWRLDRIMRCWQRTRFGASRLVMLDMGTDEVS